MASRSSNVAVLIPLDRARALDSDQRPLSPDVHHCVFVLRVRPDPVEVAILVSGIDDQQVSAVGHRVDEHVIDNAAGVVTEHRVLDPAGPQACHVATDDPLGEAPVGDA